MSKSRFDKAVRPLLPPEYQEVKVEFRRRDFLQVLPGLAETDVWLAHSTLFDDEVSKRISFLQYNSLSMVAQRLCCR